MNLKVHLQHQRVPVAAQQRPHAPARLLEILGGCGPVDPGGGAMLDVVAVQGFRAPSPTVRDCRIREEEAFSLPTSKSIFSISKCLDP